MNKIFSFLFLLAGSVAFASAAKVPLPAAPAPMASPMQAIKELDTMTTQYKTGKNLTKADKDFNWQLKQKILRGTFDLRELAKLSLDKYWDQRSVREQDRFVELLTNLLEERSIFAKERANEKGAGQSYSIEYKKESYLDTNRTKAKVTTIVRLKKKNMSVDLSYKLKKTPQGWKIYDVIMDGASLVDNYRYSFGSIIKKDGYPDLVRRMEKKLKEFRAKNV